MQKKLDIFVDRLKVASIMSASFGGKASERKHEKVDVDSGFRLCIMCASAGPAPSGCSLKIHDQVICVGAHVDRLGIARDIGMSR